MPVGKKRAASAPTGGTEGVGWWYGSQSAYARSAWALTSGGEPSVWQGLWATNLAQKNDAGTREKTLGRREMDGFLEGPCEPGNPLSKSEERST